MDSLKNKFKLISHQWYYLLSIIFLYFIYFIFDNQVFWIIFNYAIELLKNILPVLIIVFIFMVISDFFISPEFILKHFYLYKKRKWILVILGGILSVGPPYVWYPLLASLRYKVLDDGMIACFLYNWAIKIPLLPIAFIYFNWLYVLILLIVMILASLVQGFIINKLMKTTN
jgi:uncharacterized membrane protein YraQ (UPF0718 family)